jgi:hypothetical protein
VRKTVSQYCKGEYESGGIRTGVDLSERLVPFNWSRGHLRVAADSSLVLDGKFVGQRNAESCHPS